MSSDTMHAIVLSILYLIILGCCLMLMGLNIIEIAIILLSVIMMFRGIHALGVSDGIMRVKK